MKNIQIVVAVITVLIGSISTWDANPSIYSTSGYSFFSYVGGNPTLSVNWTLVSFASTDACPAASGTPCLIKARKKTPTDTHPWDTDILVLKSLAGSGMDHAVTAPSDPNLQLWVKVYAR